MVVTKQIDDYELIDLIQLYADYNKCLVTKHNKYNSTSILITKLQLPNALAIGLYKNDKLIGFTLGNSSSNKVFHFTDMYITPRYRFYIKKLLESSEAFIRPKYKAWVSESHTKEGIEMFEHYGAQRTEIKYYKEL